MKKDTFSHFRQPYIFFEFSKHLNAKRHANFLSSQRLLFSCFFPKWRRRIHSSIKTRNMCKKILSCREYVPSSPRPRPKQKTHSLPEVCQIFNNSHSSSFFFPSPGYAGGEEREREREMKTNSPFPPTSSYNPTPCFPRLIPVCSPPIYSNTRGVRPCRPMIFSE